MSDKVILDLIKQEYERQKNTIELIASENYPSVESSNAMASILTCKYSEGYPGKRYYNGTSVFVSVNILFPWRRFLQALRVWRVVLDTAQV